MLDQEFIDESIRIKNIQTRSMNSLMSKYLHANALYKVDDFLKTQNGGDVIKVTSIQYRRPNVFGNNTDVPMVVYNGLLLTKSMKLRKDKDSRSFCQPDVQKVEVKL